MLESKGININTSDLDEMFTFCSDEQRKHLRQYGTDPNQRTLIFRMYDKDHDKVGVWTFPRGDTRLPSEIYDKYRTAYQEMKTKLSVGSTKNTDINYIENTALTIVDIITHPKVWDLPENMAALAWSAYRVMMQYAEKYSPETLDANIVYIQLDTDDYQITHSVVTFNPKPVKTLQ